MQQSKRFACRKADPSLKQASKNPLRAGKRLPGGKCFLLSGSRVRARGQVRASDPAIHASATYRPKYAESRNNIEITLVDLGRALEAAPHFEEAVRIDPDFANAHYGLGMALEKAGQVQAAIVEYDRALSVQHDLRPAKDALTRLHSQPR